MRSRIEILGELVLLQGDIKMLEKELSQYSWDVEKPLIRMSMKDFSGVLKRGISNEIDIETLMNWANSIECREDIEFENEEMQEIIFELSNPEINGNISKERLSEIIWGLEN